VFSFNNFSKEKVTTKHKKPQSYDSSEGYRNSHENEGWGEIALP
jgi:hypothetical protein